MIVKASIRTNNISKGIIGTMRNLAMRRAGLESLAPASSLVARRISKVIIIMPGINLLTCLH